MGVLPAQHNFALKRRSDFSVVLRFKDCNKDPINLTGWSVSFQLWDEGRTQLYTTASIDYINRIAGEIEASLTSNQTAALPTTVFYDVLVVNPSGLKEYYLEGTIRVTEGYSE